MKKILFTFLFLAAFVAGNSQMANNGGVITVENGATLVIEGNYTSTNGGVFDIKGNVQLKGSYINNGGSITTGSSGLLTFNGTSGQEITGSQSTTFHCAVAVNNSAGVALTNTQTGANQVADSTLTLTSGKVTLNQFNLTVNQALNATASNYVVTNGAGLLKRPVAATNVTFPVGISTSYNPLVLNNAGTADTYGVGYANTLPGSWPGTTHAVNGSWTVTEAVGGGSNLTATPQWNGTQEQSGFARTDCYVGVTTNSGVTTTYAPGGAASGTDPYTRSGAGFTSVGQFLVADYFFRGIDLDLDVFLAGPYSGSVMSTALKTNNLIPLNDPYSNGTSVATIANANTVDWIEVQLRNSTSPGPGSIVKKYSVFVDKNGKVLHTDGNIGMKLTGVAKASYYIAVRHRNHLGAMTANPIDFTAAGPFAFNFTSGTGIYGTNAMQNIAGVYALWAGDANGDGQIVFQGASNDPTPIGNQVNGDPGNTGNSFTYIVNGYLNTDINMDGQVIFQGAGNDPTPVGNSVNSHPGNPSHSFTYPILQQLP
jgi:hypothetical protein